MAHVGFGVKALEREKQMVYNAPAREFCKLSPKE